MVIVGMCDIYLFTVNIIYMNRFLLILLLCATNAFGQRYSIGLRSGVDFSNFFMHNASGPASLPTVESFLEGSVVIDPNTKGPLPAYHYETNFFRDMRIGYFSYLYVNVPIHDRFSFQTGLGFSQRGIDLDYEQHAITFSGENTIDTQYRFRRDMRMDYMTLPMTFQYSLGKKQRWYVVGGIYNAVGVSFLIRDSHVAVRERVFNTTSGRMVSSSEQISIDDKTYSKRIDVGLIGGFGFQMPVSERILLGIDVRSLAALTNTPGRYPEYGFQGFGRQSRNISFETGLKIQYSLVRQP